MEYKNTLNLPKTDFPMKADLSRREPEFLREWQEQGVYRLICQKSEGRKKYILHDGPPYANGDIHLGHALNKTLKDIIVKYKTMRGYDSAYVPGWDCHGLPVEHQLFKELGITKYQIDQVEFRKKAFDYALRFVNTQKEQFKRLGVFGDWENPYLTLDRGYEEGIARSLGELAKKGYIYRGLKPVNWCYKCETALAEAEVEYENHTSPSIFVKFKLEETKGYGPESFLLIWTTTPWTLMANVAVAVHPDFTYCYINTEKGKLIVAKDLFLNIFAQGKIEKYEIIREMTGRDLEGLVYDHPFGLRKAKVVLADYVSKEEGSGLVHTAPGHGMEDYLTGLRYKLEIIMPVDNRGKFDATIPEEFRNMNVLEANKVILEKLEGLNLLLWQGAIQHSYPHCWRCKKPIIFRATNQWFLGIDHKDLRKKLLSAIRNDIKWVPAAGRERIAAMVEFRPDWCLSRQRYWGVPIPSVICSACGNEILEPRIIEKFADFIKAEGSECWFKRDIKDFSSADFQCVCGSKDFSKGTDILDVWFDSGISSQAVLKKRKELEFPCALYLEGSDQHRGWFQSSLIPAMCIDEKPPFESVLTHGFVVDAEGRKMSKSQGNVISPFEIIKNYGADILRLWVASSDYNEDIRISPVILSRIAEAYRKIRNTSRFVLSNLYDFSPDTDKINYARLKKIDQWILFRLQKVLSLVTAAYENFEFHKAYKGIYDFCNVDLSMYYLDMAKGRLYTFGASSEGRRGAQTVICEALGVLARIISPILVFTAEEIWQNIPKEKKGGLSASVHLADWPQENPLYLAADIDRELNAALELIPGIAKALEEKRASSIIGSSFDARINILTKDQIRYTNLQALKSDLPEMFKVSQVEISLGDKDGVEVYKAGGNKCERCWNYSFDVGLNAAHPEICPRCIEAIGQSDQ